MITGIPIWTALACAAWSTSFLLAAAENREAKR